MKILRTTLMNIMKNKAKYKGQFESGGVNLNTKKKCIRNSEKYR